MFIAELALGRGLGGHDPSAVADAGHRAAAVLRTEVGVEPAPGPPAGAVGITLLSRAAQGFTAASVVREAIRLATEILAGLGETGTGAGGPGSTFPVHVSGAGARDVRDLEAFLLQDVRGDFRIVEDDPETDTVRDLRGPGRPAPRCSARSPSASCAASSRSARTSLRIARTRWPPASAGRASVAGTRSLPVGPAAKVGWWRRRSRSRRTNAAAQCGN